MKPEIRRPKPERRPKSEGRKKAQGARQSSDSDFGPRVSFGLRFVLLKLHPKWLQFSFVLGSLFSSCSWNQTDPRLCGYICYSPAKAGTSAPRVGRQNSRRSLDKPMAKLGEFPRFAFQMCASDYSYYNQTSPCFFSKKFIHAEESKSCCFFICGRPESAGKRSIPVRVLLYVLCG